MKPAQVFTQSKYLGHFSLFGPLPSFPVPSVQFNGNVHSTARSVIHHLGIEPWKTLFLYSQILLFTPCKKIMLIIDSVNKSII